ncbi:hypothetical protein [Halobacterium salinarum]|uniref:hypothetical protein n=1 Tax=Halobacterium salinarum TaxID=2242 RepID=UPI00255505A2|nr:hypothetical protein [Halobacterium salinarum]MDL0123114.1 hypothetical protein [Halobacterium salinarum]MDL0131393.1 hypothetical protein [Halobacterium salinarum]
MLTEEAGDAASNYLSGRKVQERIWGQDPIENRVTRVVELQTTSKQPEAVPVHTVVQILAANGSYSGQEVRDGIEHAIEDGLLKANEAGKLQVPEGVTVPSKV